MGRLTFVMNLTLDGCVDHREGVVDAETQTYFTSLLSQSSAILWGRVTYEMMEDFWPRVASGEIDAPQATKDWAVTLEAKPKYVVSTTRVEFPWTNSHRLEGDLVEAVQALKSASPHGVLVASTKLATALDRLDLIAGSCFGLGPALRMSYAAAEADLIEACARLALARRSLTRNL